MAKETNAELIKRLNSTYNRKNTGEDGPPPDGGWKLTAANHKKSLIEKAAAKAEEPIRSYDDLTDIEKEIWAHESGILPREPLENRDPFEALKQLSKRGTLSEEDLLRLDASIQVDPILADAKFEPEPNVLDNFDLTTYHFKLYMIDNASVEAQQYISPRKRVTIAESGVTAAILIDSVELTTFVGQHYENKNKQTTAFKFGLSEPFGASLIDRIYMASLELSIVNYTESMFFLELTFRGRDAKTSEPVMPTQIGDHKMTWPIKIVKIESTIETGGTMYDVNAFLYTNLGFANEYAGVTPSVLTFATGGKPADTDTIGNALQELERVFNASMSQQAALSMTFPDEIMLVVDDRLAKLPLNAEDSSQSRKGAETTHTKEPKPLTIPKNYSLLRAINNIMTASAEYVRRARDADVAAKEENSEKKPKLKKTHRVSTYIQHIGTDIIRNVPRRRFVFIISEFKTASLISNMSELTGNKDSGTTFDELVKINAIRKHYNYVYTGLNDQILEFEAKFNFGWYVSRPIFGGNDISISQVLEGAVFKDKFKDKFRSVITAYRNLSRAFETQSKRVELFSKTSYADAEVLRERPGGFAETSAWSAIGYATGITLGRDVPDIEKEKAYMAKQTDGEHVLVQLNSLTLGEIQVAFDAEMERTKNLPAERQAVVHLYLNRIAVSAQHLGGDEYIFLWDDGIASKITRADYMKIQARIKSFSGMLSSDRFEELGINATIPETPFSGSVDTSFLSDIEVPEIKPEIIPITFSISDAVHDSADSHGVPLMEEDSNSGSPYMDSLWGQAFSTEGGDMVELKMTIKGDPFWIETPPLFNTSNILEGSHEKETLRRFLTAITKTFELDDLKNKGAMYSGGRVFSTNKQNYFMFSVNTPIVADVDTGIIAQRTEAYNGIYAVNQVKSIFSHGKFTQELTAYRELGVSTGEIEKTQGGNPDIDKGISDG